MDEILEVSVIKAIELGFIDIPFAPHQKNAGLLWCARDNHKNIRVVDFGNIPTTKEFKMFETQRVGVNQKSNSIAAILDDINIMI